MRVLPHVLAVLALLAVVAAFAGTVACSKLTEPPKPENIQVEPPPAEPKEAASAGASASAAPSAAPSAPPVDEKVVSKDLVVGKGPEAKSGDSISVHYAGTFPDGKEFDSSKKHGDKPFDFVLGAGNVIKGWDDGVVGMKVGGKRKLTIPPSLAYGARGRPGIPPNSTLVFEIELLKINKK